jgi:hypothetical protein
MKRKPIVTACSLRFTERKGFYLNNKEDTQLDATITVH